MTEPVVTTTMFTPAEQAGWQVAVERGLPVEAADVRALLEAAAPLIAAAERDRIEVGVHKMLISIQRLTHNMPPEIALGYNAQEEVLATVLELLGEEPS